MGDPLPPTARDSAPSEDTPDAEQAMTEPLVLDLEQVHADPEHAPAQHIFNKTPDQNPLPSPSLQVEDDAAADPPPDFTRRGIHIPTRTR